MRGLVKHGVNEVKSTVRIYIVWQGLNEKLRPRLDSSGQCSKQAASAEKDFPFTSFHIPIPRDTNHNIYVYNYIHGVWLFDLNRGKINHICTHWYLILDHNPGQHCWNVLFFLHPQILLVFYGRTLTTRAWIRNRWSWIMSPSIWKRQSHKHFSNFRPIVVLTHDVPYSTNGSESNKHHRRVIYQIVIKNSWRIVQCHTHSCSLKLQESQPA